MFDFIFLGEHFDLSFEDIVEARVGVHSFLEQYLTWAIHLLLHPQSNFIKELRRELILKQFLIHEDFPIELSVHIVFEVI